MRRYYRKATDRILKASMGALMAAEKNPVRTLMLGPFAITWARHSETDTETYTRIIKALTVAEYSEEYKFQKARAEAWEEGFTAGHATHVRQTSGIDPLPAPRNPYLNPSNSMGIDTKEKTDD